MAILTGIKARSSAQRFAGMSSNLDDFLWFSGHIVLDSNDSGVGGADSHQYLWIQDPEEWLNVPVGASMGLTVTYAVINATTAPTLQVQRSLAPVILDKEAAFEDMVSGGIVLTRAGTANRGALQTLTRTILVTNPGADKIPLGALRLRVVNNDTSLWLGLRLRVHVRIFNV